MYDGFELSGDRLREHVVCKIGDGGHGALVGTRMVKGQATRQNESQGQDELETVVERGHSRGTQGAQPFVKIPFVNRQQLRDVNNGLFLQATLRPAQPNVSRD